MIKHKDFSDYESTFKNYILGVIYILTVLYLLNFVFFYFTAAMLWMRYFFLSFFILNVLYTIIIHTIPYVYLIKLIKPIIIVMFFLYYPMAVWHLSMGVVASLLWFIVIPMFFYVALPGINIVRWLFWCCTLLLLALVAGYTLWYLFYNNDFIPKTSYDYQMIVIIPNILNIIATFLFASHSLVYINHFNNIKVSTIEKEKTQKNYTIISSDQKFEKMYEKIVLYVESTEPYLNSNFKIGELSSKLNINTVYINKAILCHKNMNFNNFINSYRIAYAKKLIQKNPQYTIEYIYQSSGFKNQSSFNRAFKVQENTTPSEYRMSLLHSKS